MSQQLDLFPSRPIIKARDGVVMIRGVVCHPESDFVVNHWAPATLAGFMLLKRGAA